MSCPLASLVASAKALAISREFLMLRDDETDGRLFSSSLEGLSLARALILFSSASKYLHIRKSVYMYSGFPVVMVMTGQPASKLEPVPGGLLSAFLGVTAEWKSVRGKIRFERDQRTYK